LKLTFAEYRQGHSINLTATATTQTATVVSEEQRARLIALREQITSSAGGLTNAKQIHATEVRPDAAQPTSAPKNAPKKLPTNPDEPAYVEETPANVEGDEEQWGHMPGVPGLE
jgi:hypothetical protein